MMLVLKAEESMLSDEPTMTQQVYARGGTPSAGRRALGHHGRAAVGSSGDPGHSRPIAVHERVPMRPNGSSAVVAALIASLDGLLLTQSRIAMNDIYVTF